ncbi:hypothetical protein K490DRAFT_68962 [Saccharata proteae CBS 121410]|uniref:Uncharacterized protein n=1 Tax=Saccharata proteae CBS 121410 TaxID=1314787 RepID=A0A9P4LWM9_9PEZI|nr:hypothetical protein K490DRAFT_68962 [Saccharata proteae CBS 121410]
MFGTLVQVAVIALAASQAVAGPAFARSPSQFTTYSNATTSALSSTHGSTSVHSSDALSTRSTLGTPGTPSIFSTPHSSTASRTHFDSVDAQYPFDPKLKLFREVLFEVERASVHAYNAQYAHDTLEHCEIIVFFFLGLQKQCESDDTVHSNDSHLFRGWINTGKSTDVVVITGGGVTSAVPVTVTTSINPTGTEASSSAKVLSSKIASVSPIIQSWIRNQNDDTSSAAIKAIEDVGPLADDLLAEIGEGSSDTSSCTASLFGLVSCISSSLDDVESAITTGADEAVDDVTADLGDLVDLSDSLDNDDDDNKSSKQTSQEKTSTKASSSASSKTSASSSQSSSSSSSSCSEGSTTRDVYVTCYPTTITTSGSTVTQSCTTSSAAISGCGLTAYTTTTTVSSSSSTGFACAQTGCPACLSNTVTKPTATCSGCLSGTDGLPQATTSLATGTTSSLKSNKKKRTLSTPDNYSDVGDFISWEVFWAESMGGLVPHRGAGTGGASSSLFRDFGSIPHNMAVQNLYGCTSVVVLSELGCWMSHFWEDPSFQDDATFQTDVITQMRDGDGTGWITGLSSYTGSQFAQAQDPQVLIVTPRNRTHPVDGVYMFPDKVTQMQNTIRSILPSANIGVADYTPRGPNTGNAYGKVLVQYDNSETVQPRIDGCGGTIQVAISRVWVEDNPDPIYEHRWIAEDSQQNANANRKRDSSACSLTGTSSGTASSTSKPASTTGASSTRSRATTTPSTDGASAPSTPGSTSSANSTTSDASSARTGGSTLVTTTRASSSRASSASSSSKITSSSGIKTTTSASTSTTTSATSTEALSCAPTTVVPTGAPQSNLSSAISEWCAHEYKSWSTHVGCDNEAHDGMYFTNTCDLPVTNDELQYYYDGVTAWLNMTLVAGDTFLVQEDQCTKGLLTVLNGCAPFSAASGETLHKFGGSYNITNGDGAVMQFSIDLKDAPGQTG